MSTCYVAHETSQGFLTGAGSRIPVAYDKGGPVEFMVFCRRAISESPDLRTMYMISVFISVYMLCCTWNIPGWFPTGVGSLIPAAYVKGCPVKCSPPAAVWTSRRAKAMNKVGVCDWLPLYYHAGMYRVPFCYIAVHCNKERLGYLRNLGSLSRNQI